MFAGFLKFEFELFDIVNFSEIVEHGCIQYGHADGEHFRRIIFDIIHASEFELIHVFRGKKGLDALKCFFKVACLTGPRIQTWSLDVAFLADENVLGPEIAHFTIKYFFHFDLGSWKAEKQEPELALLEFRLAFFSVLDFLNEKVGKIFVGDLNYEDGTVRVPVEPQKPLVENWCDLGMSK